MTHSNGIVIKQFYTAFQQKDYKTMQRLYEAQATFSDPVFQNLNAEEVRAMWQMLVTAAKDLRIDFNDISADDDKGSCQWEAWYTFSRTGKKVHNIIQASFEFRNGLILHHTDSFDFWRWSHQALGLTGSLLGWSAFLKNKVSSTAMSGLKKFMSTPRA